MHRIVHDMRFAARQIRRAPGFALAAMVVLALSIGANVIVFGILRAIILQPIHAAAPDRLVTFAPSPHGYPAFSWPEVRDVREQSRSFSAVGAEAMNVFGVEIQGETRPLWGNEVGGQYFEALGIRPALGRLLAASDDDHPGASQAVVLSWPAWNSLFAADPGVIGRVIRINRQPYTVVGVTEPGFYGTWKFLAPSFFVPLANEAALEGTNWREDRGDRHVFPIARLRDGVTTAQAQAELDTLAAGIRRRNPKQEDRLAFWLAEPGLAGDFIARPARAFLAGVMALAALVLLAGCANLGGLFTARTADRTREIAIRMAVGSSRWRIVRQILVEAGMVSLAGGAAAAALSWAALRGLARWTPPSDYPIHFDVAPTPSLLWAALLLSVLAACLFGLTPLWQIFRADPNEAIRGAGNVQSTGVRRWSLRDLLLAVQIALCSVAVTAAFVSLRGLERTMTMDVGFDPHNAVLAKYDLGPAGYSGPAAARIEQQVLETVKALPGVEAAAYANTTPLADTVTTGIYLPETADLRPSNRAFESFYYSVSPGYFAAARTPILEGRPLLAGDTASAPPVAVVSQEFARRLYGTEHAVGRAFRDSSGRLVRIVGVAREGKYFLTSEDPDYAVFYPIAQRPDASVSLVVRIHPSPGPEAALAMTRRVRGVIRDLDPAIPIRQASPWTSALAFSFFPAQVATVSLGLFGALGLLLSVTGTFGLASYTVTRRMRELSIRVALGAGARDVVSTALGRLLTMLGLGSVAGVLLGAAASRLLAAIVYQASARDPLVLLAVAVTALLAGLCAVAGPVRRALSVDPALVLREQ